jgi:hypothetical protein
MTHAICGFKRKWQQHMRVGFALSGSPEKYRNKKPSWPRKTITNKMPPIHRPPLRTSKLQKKPSALKGEHPALQNKKFLNFSYFWGSLFYPPGFGSGSRF